MNKITSISNIDFADSEFKSFEFDIDNSSLIVYLNSWDDKIIKCIFFDMIQFVYKPGDVVEGVFEIFEGSDFLEESLKLIYEKRPLNHGYKLFQIKDIEDFSFIEVVAQTVHIVKITVKD